MLALDVSAITDVADVFLIASGTNRTQAQAIISAVEEALRNAGEKSYHIEGYENAKWILLDAGDIVIHVFQPETREYYALERLWADASAFDPGDMEIS